jgi:CRP/FNR family transcriptional regulator
MSQILARETCLADKTGVCATCRVRSVSVCSALEGEALEQFGAMAEDTAFTAKSTIVQEGDSARHVFNITGGTVRTFRLLPDGRRQLFGFLLPGDFLGLSLNEQYRFSAEAVDDVTVCRFDRLKFAAFLNDHPTLLRRLHEAASNELGLAQDQAVLLGRRTAEQKLAGFIVSLRDRLKRLGGSAVTIPLAMSRLDIADYLGLTIETVSRTVTALTAARVVLVVPGGLRILDAGKLEAAAAG